MKLCSFELAEAAAAGDSTRLVATAARYMGIAFAVDDIPIEHSNYLITLSNWSRVEICTGDFTHILFKDNLRVTGHWNSTYYIGAFISAW